MSVIGKGEGVKNLGVRRDKTERQKIGKYKGKYKENPTKGNIRQNLLYTFTFRKTS